MSSKEKDTKEEKVKLSEFIEEFKEALIQRVVTEYPALYRPDDEREKYSKVLAGLKRKPYPAQIDTVGTVATILQKESSAVIVGEMGIGKTICGIGSAYAIGAKNILVCCPPHLVRKWEREIRMTVNDVDVSHLKTVSDIMKIRKFHFLNGKNGKKPMYCIVSRERAKLGYSWRPAVVKRVMKDPDGVVVFDKTRKRKLSLRERTDRIAKMIIYTCPSCGMSLKDEEGVFLTMTDIERRKKKCANCGSPLWMADREGPKRYPIAEYIKKYLTKQFDFFILDESHEYKGKNTAQGIAAGIMASTAKKSLALVGTLFGGYSRTLFYILHRFTQGFHKDFHYDEEGKWVNLYGIVEKITRRKDDENLDDNLTSRGKKGHTTVRERPGISPVILPKYLLGRCVFVRLADIAIGLPKYDEFITTVEMEPEQKEAYLEFQSDLVTALREALSRGDKSLLSKYLQGLLCYPEQPWIGEVVKNRANEIVAIARKLPEDKTYPKEEELIEIIKQEKAAGRKVLVYCSHTDRRDMTHRIRDKVSECGARVDILAANIPPEKREDWIIAHAKGLDVLITNPKLVQTGLDLIDFQTIVFHEIEYSVYVLRQASRRSWRIGQTKPVKVYYFVYAETIQEKGLKLIAQKFKTSLAIEGELLDDGLATYNTASTDMYYDLARSIVSGVESVPGSLDAIWADVRMKENEILGIVSQAEEIVEKVAEVIRVEGPKAANDLFDKLWEKMKEERKKVPLKKKVDERQLFLFQ